MKRVKRQDVAQLSREELLEAVKQSPLEKAIDARTQPTILILITLCMIVLYCGGLRNILVFVFMFIGGLGLMIGFMDALLGFRTRHIRRELLERYGPRDNNLLEKRAKTALKQADGPDWIAILHGRALPHGGTVDLVAEIYTAPLGGRILQRRCSFPDFAKEPPFTSESADLTLTADQCSILLNELAGFNSARPEKLHSMVIDGFPCILSVFRRSPLSQKCFECNLAGVLEDDAGKLGPCIMEALLALTEDQTETPMIVGSCDLYGNIEIDGV